MNNMQWKRTAPTEPGFYYWRGGPHLSAYDNTVAVVQVVAFRDHTRELEASELRADGYVNAPNRGPVSRWGGEWAGPLPQPYY